jgi:hypothetical protein
MIEMAYRLDKITEREKWDLESELHNKYFVGVRGY